MRTCCIGLGLLATVTAVALEWMEIEGRPDEIVEQTRKHYKDPEILRETLEGCFSLPHFLSWSGDPLRFKRKFEIADDTLRAVLLDIYGSVRHLGGEPFSYDDPDELTYDKRRLRRSIEWLGYCADEKTKRLLWEVACDGTKAEAYQITAMRSYIHCANAREVRDALVRFLIDTRIKPSFAYLYAIAVYDESEGDPRKREAIVAALVVALAQEEHRGLFVSTDKELAERSKDYANSRQRLAILQRMNRLPPTNWYGDSKSLDPVIRPLRFRLFKTNVSTNLTELMARDFRKPKGD